MSPIARRLQRALRDNAPAAVALALAMLLVGASLLFAASREPVQHRESVEESRWSEEARYAYVVPITRNGSLWPPNTTLPMGEAVYYRTTSDHVPVTFFWRADGATAGAADAEMVVRIVAATPEGKPYWRIEHALAKAHVEDPAEGVALEGVVDLDALIAEAKATLDEFPLGEARISWAVETVVAYALEAPSGPIAGKSTYPLPIRVNDPRFEMPGPDEIEWTRAHATVATRTVEVPAGWAAALSDLKAVALGAAGLVLLALTAWSARRRGTTTAADLEWREEHDEHLDWITSSTHAIDPASFPAPLVEVSNLGDLVEAAADARTRVLFDAPSRVYYAVTAQVTYRYARHAQTP